MPIDTYVSDFVPLRSNNGEPLPIGKFPFTFRSDKHAHFRPDYRASTPALPENYARLSRDRQEEIESERYGYMRDNAAIFPQYLWREVVLGDTFHEGGVELSKNSAGNYYYYVPDIVSTVGGRGHDMKSKIHTEIKNCQLRARNLLEPKQTASYLNVLREGQYEMQPVSDIHFVFFRYRAKVASYTKKDMRAGRKYYYNQDTVPLGSMTGDELTEHLSQNMADALILPINLYLMLFRTGYEASSSGDRKKLHKAPVFDSKMVVNMGLHTKLTKGTATIAELLATDRKYFVKNARRFGLSHHDELLDIGLSGLEARRFMLRDGLVAVHGDNKFPVKPFPITQYVMSADSQSDFYDLLSDPAKYSLLCKQSGVPDYSDTSLQPKTDDDPDNPFG